MAESAIAFLLGKVDQLASVALREAALVWGVKDELRKLQRTLEIIRAVIMDAEQRQTQEHRIRIWIEDLTDVLHDSENVLDEFECEALRKQVVKQENTTAAEVRHFCSSSSNPLAFRMKMARKLKKIRERLDEIRDQKDAFNLNAQLLVHVDRNAVSGRILRRQESTHSYICASDVIGRDEDNYVIVEQLLHSNAINKNPFVISVVGMGGLGKTTLAKVVYNDERVKDLFQLRIWVCVSEDFSLKELVQKIITSVTKEKVDHLDLDSLQTCLREILKVKRFLLVLDDVWNDNGRKWSDLQDLLKAGAEGSSIMVTTRSSKVASAAGSSYKLELKGLSHESCMSMLKKVLQDHGEDKAMENPRLLKIANEIVEKCGGVPLVVKALAGLLCSKIDEKFWERIRDKNMWEELKKEDNILPIIRLSYDHLSPELKRCFAFCSIFPKDTLLDSRILTYYWAANGLVDTSNDDKEDREEVTAQYIKDLMERSFFQEFEDFGFHYRFKMHDIVHDLALSISKTECAIVSSDHPHSSERVRHLFFIDNDTALRVLDLPGSVFEEMPKSIGTLKHLRYFSVAGNTKIKRLPESICNLQSLQLLWLNKCMSLEELPRNMKKLISLRLLYITTKQRSLRKSGIEYLKSLRHLLLESCNNVESLFEGMDMKGLSGLRTLFVSNCGSLISLPLRGLKHMTSLETLIIDECLELDLSTKEDIQIQFGSLRTLALEGLLPEWVQGSADTLRALRVRSCSELREWLESLKNLEILIINNCPHISYMPDGIHNLKYLKIEDCGELGERCQPPNGPDWHKIAHVPLIVIDGKKIECVGGSMLSKSLHEMVSNSREV